MYYYHGSPVLFESFDVSKSKHEYYKTIHLTPNKEYAKHFLGDDGGYIYTVNIIGSDPNTVYREGMNNVCFSDVSTLEIIEVEKYKNV